MAYASRDSIKNDSNKLLADYRERRSELIAFTFPHQFSLYELTKKTINNSAH